jgi:hypothetical protein
MTGQKKDTRTFSCSSRAVRPVSVAESFESEKSFFAISGIYSKSPLEAEKPQRA